MFFKYKSNSQFKIKRHFIIAQSAGAVKYTNCTSAEGYDPQQRSVMYMTLNNLMVWGSSIAGALGNVKYSFIAIAPRSTLFQSGSTW